MQFTFLLFYQNKYRILHRILAFYINRPKIMHHWTQNSYSGHTINSSKNLLQLFHCPQSVRYYFVFSNGNGNYLRVSIIAWMIFYCALVISCIQFSVFFYSITFPYFSYFYYHQKINSKAKVKNKTPFLSFRLLNSQRLTFISAKACIHGWGWWPLLSHLFLFHFILYFIFAVSFGSRAD